MKSAIKKIRNSFLIISLGLFSSLYADDFDNLWQTHDNASTLQVDHAPWQHILSDYVVVHEDGINMFDYAGVTAIDRKILADYLASLQNVTVSSLNQSEQMAYWINFYNALTIRVILDHYPVESIKDISYSLLDWGPWAEELVVVQGYELSLNDIEHRILRPVFKDNRIHYAVNCASIGCPNLQPQAFSGGNLDMLLNKGARDFINHPRAVTLQGTLLTLSSLYEWYYEDFAESDDELMQHLRQFADDELAARLSGKLKIQDYEYDWSLNQSAAES